MSAIGSGSPLLSFGTARARWVLAATVLGSGMALIDATVVNIALPAVEEDLGAGTAGLTWTVNAYTLTLASLILLGGSLGDRLGRRRVFRVGVAWFALASLSCAAAPTVEALVVARGLQGVGGALLTPGSLAILQASFRSEDRGRAIGVWSGVSGVAAAAGPLLGGWLVGVGSWRWIFVVNLPVALVVLALSSHIPESSDPDAPQHTDVAGVLLAAGGLGLLTLGLSGATGAGFDSPAVLVAVGAGLLLLVAFVLHERAATGPMLPLTVFRSRVFSATNAVTFAVYAAVAGVVFWLVVTLQVVTGLPPIEAGLALLPLTVSMLLLSPLAGVVSQRIGPRLPMTLGPLLAAVGVALLMRIDQDSSFARDVLPCTTLFALGMTATVTPLTTTVLAAVPDTQAGLASGVNNAVARTAGLLAVAILPAVTGIGATGLGDPDQLLPAFRIAMAVCAGLLGTGGLLSLVFVRRPRPHARECPKRHCDVCGPPLASLEDVRAASR